MVLLLMDILNMMYLNYLIYILNMKNDILKKYIIYFITSTSNWWTLFIIIWFTYTSIRLTKCSKLCIITRCTSTGILARLTFGITFYNCRIGIYINTPALQHHNIHPYIHMYHSIIFYYVNYSMIYTMFL